MGEKEKPPAKPEDIYLLISFLLKTFNHVLDFAFDRVY